MYSMILQKKAELKAMMPDDPEFTSWLEQSDLWCWLYSLLRIMGKRVSKGSVVAILAGELRDDVPLSLYAFVKSCKDVYYDMKSSLQMQSALDVKLLNRWAGMLLDKDSVFPEATLYRSNNPIVYEWELIPAHFREIKERFAEIFKNAAQVKDPKLSIEKAAYICLETNRLYPYGEDTVIASSAALLYQILEMGLPMPELPVGDVEYNKMIAKYVEDKDPSAFINMLERSIYNRLDAVISIARQAEEQAGGDA